MLDGHGTVKVGRKNASIPLIAIGVEFGKVAVAARARPTNTRRETIPSRAT